MNMYIDGEMSGQEIAHLMSAPLVRALAEIEMIMPLSFAINSDGTLTKLHRHGWPKWAIAYSEFLEQEISKIYEQHRTDNSQNSSQEGRGRYDHYPPKG